MRVFVADQGLWSPAMAEKQQLAEWLLNADFCRRMADRADDPGRKTMWLMLAQRWLSLGEPGSLIQADTESQQFEAAALDQRSSESSN